MEALKHLVYLIESAGLANLAKGVQLGQTSWFVKASDAMIWAKRAIAEDQPGQEILEDKFPPAAAAPVPPDVQAMQKELGKLKTELERVTWESRQWKEQAQEVVRCREDLADTQAALARQREDLAWQKVQRPPVHAYGRPWRTCHKCGKDLATGGAWYAGGGARLCMSCGSEPIAPASPPAPLAPRLAEFAQAVAWLMARLVHNQKCWAGITDSQRSNLDAGVKRVDAAADKFSQHCKTP
jgi:hypothetical protein